MWTKYLFIFLFAIGLAVLASFFNGVFYDYPIFWDYLFTYLLYYGAGTLILFTQKPITKFGYIICILLPIYLIITYIFIDRPFNFAYIVLDSIKIGVITIGAILPLMFYEKEGNSTKRFFKRAFMFMALIPCLFLIQTFIVAPLEYTQSNWQVRSGLQIELEQSAVIDKDSTSLLLPLNKVLVLNFTFHACTPCQLKVKPYHQLSNKFRNNPNVVFYTIHEIEGYQFFKEQYAHIPHAYHDVTGIFAKIMNVKGYPTEIIVNKKGEICNIMQGFDLEMEEYYLEERSKLIQKLIHEK